MTTIRSIYEATNYSIRLRINLSLSVISLTFYYSFTIKFVIWKSLENPFKKVFIIFSSLPLFYWLISMSLSSYLPITIWAYLFIYREPRCRIMYTESVYSTITNMWIGSRLVDSHLKSLAKLKAELYKYSRPLHFVQLNISYRSQNES